MNSYRHLTIEEAKEIAQSHGLEQIAVWHFRTGEGQHVTTWGEPFRHSALAAEAGNHIKKAAGWPAELCQDLPGSLRTLFDEADTAISEAVREGKIGKGAALIFFYTIREVIRARDPRLAEQLIPVLTEACELP